MSSKRYISEIIINSELDVEYKDLIDKDLKEVLDKEIKKAIENILNTKDIYVNSSIIEYI